MTVEGTPAEDPPLQNDHCTTLKVVSKPLIINEIVVEEAGVELIRALTARQVIDSRKFHKG